MLTQLPGGTAIDTEGNTVIAADNGEIRMHTTQALSRLIERWRADNNPNLAALVMSVNDEVQELENAIWDVIVGRLPDYAEGAQLDALGRTVGQSREGLGDAAFRAHIKARVRINQSFGTPADVIEVLRLVDSVAFHLVELGTATFSVYYDAPPSNAAIGHEIPTLVRQARAAGVRATVSFPVDLVGGRGAFFGSTGAPTLNAARGWSSSYNSAVGGLFGHAATA
jgi:hypothetical protein